jgi:hydroxymethylbilane synthase
MNDPKSKILNPKSFVGRRSSITIGTRGSKLALAQTHMIRAAIEAAKPGITVAVETITTKGDVVLDRPLSAIGDKGLFVTEIEDALRDGRVDLAVHSAKDMPSELPPDMALVVFPAREDARDALVSRRGLRFADLPERALVGTSSLRRACQLRHLRPDLQIADLRGNVDTRLRKLHEGQYDAIILAAAGLRRLGLASEITELLDPVVMLPAVAQGALAVEARAGDTELAGLLAPLDDRATYTAVTAERAFLARVGGGCQVPVAAYARLDGPPGEELLVLEGLIGSRAGRILRGALRGPAATPAALGAALAETLLDQGGRELLLGDR